MSDLSSNVSCAPESQRMGSFQEHIQGAHVETHFGSYLSQILMDFISIWVILKLIKIGPKSPKSPNSEGSGSDQNPDRKARKPSPDRANNIHNPGNYGVTLTWYLFQTPAPASTRASPTTCTSRKAAGSASAAPSPTPPRRPLTSTGMD